MLLCIFSGGIVAEQFVWSVSQCDYTLYYHKYAAKIHTWKLIRMSNPKHGQDLDLELINRLNTF